MIKVTAIANGYYGGKVRVPGESFGIEDEAAFSDVWMTRDEPKIVETRRANTGGTDGVVGVTVPKPGQKLTAAERVAAAKALTGREDITTAKEADAILAAAQPLAGSDNDDRSRDLAIDQSQNANVPEPDGDTLDGPVTNVRIVDGDI